MKRFTETDKWRDSWFRKLKPMSKLAFLFIVDNCDSAGVWDPDYDLANFHVGEPVNWPEVLADLGERVETLKNGKWHLVRFVDFQYGQLVQECRPHAKILSLLQFHGIEYKGYGKGIHTHKIRQDRKKTGKEEDRTPPSDQPANPFSADAIYAEYPRKEAKGAALKAISKAMERCEPLKLFTLTKEYAEAVAKWPAEDRKFIPHPATWYNRDSYEDDPKNWKRNANTSTSSTRSFSDRQDYSGVTEKL